MRDMTQKQFDEACRRYGFTPCGFLGYYRVNNAGVQVSILNAGKRRRDQLAYLLRERERVEKREAERGVTVI